MATVDNQVIIERIDSLKQRMDELHNDIRARLDRINGSVSSHTEYISANRERVLAQYAAVAALQASVGQHDLMFAEHRGGMRMAIIVASAIGSLIVLIGGPLVSHFLYLAP
jgi:hypothetical protein